VQSYFPAFFGLPPIHDFGGRGGEARWGGVAKPLNPLNPPDVFALAIGLCSSNNEMGLGNAGKTGNEPITDLC
jgi:hypothetical protein